MKNVLQITTMNTAARVGSYSLNILQEIRYQVAVILGVLSTGVKKRYWVKTVRTELIRQIYSSGVGSIGFVAYIAFAVGVSIVAQALVWMDKIGQSTLLGPLFVTILIREAAPLLNNILAITRNGTAITTELGNMKISGNVQALDAQGLDPFIYLVMPRVLGLMISVFCLNAVFLIVSFTTGYIAGFLLSPDITDPYSFVNSIFKSIDAVDFVSLIAKSIIPALFTGSICCTEGLRVGRSYTDVTIATKRALSRSVRALFITSMLISLLTYM